MSNTLLQWTPARTRVFAVGILEYGDGVHWELEGRRDKVLLETLVQRGVPRSNICGVWDREATQENIIEQLRSHLEASREGEQLLFYYAGHGGRDEHGNGVFCSYNGDFPMAEVFRWIERSFKGAGVLLTADCCCSGSLAIEAAKRAGRVPCAALTSSMSTTASTGAWTFTDCLINGFEGRLAIDTDGDGVLRLEELAAYVERRMAQFDGQLSTFAAVNGFPANMVLGTALAEGDHRVGTLVEGEWDGAWYRAEVREVGAQGVFLHWLDEDGENDCWVTEERVRPWTPQTHPPGKAVQVLESDQWWNAEVLTSKLGMHLVRYDQYGPHYDEWVSIDRIREPE